MQQNFSIHTITYRPNINQESYFKNAMLTDFTKPRYYVFDMFRYASGVAYR